jgi:hypothetical protein
VGLKFPKLPCRAAAAASSAAAVRLKRELETRNYVYSLVASSVASPVTRSWRLLVKYMSNKRVTPTRASHEGRLLVALLLHQYICSRLSTWRIDSTAQISWYSAVVKLVILLHCKPKTIPYNNSKLSNCVGDSGHH